MNSSIGEINRLLHNNESNEEEYKKFNIYDVLVCFKHYLYYTFEVPQKMIKLYINLFINHNAEIKFYPDVVNGYYSDTKQVIKHGGQKGEVIATYNVCGYKDVKIGTNKRYSRNNRQDEGYLEIVSTEAMNKEVANEENKYIVNPSYSLLYNIVSYTIPYELKNILKNDDVDKLIEFYLREGFQRYTNSTICLSLSLTNLSELLGAVKCFKHLVVDGKYDKFDPNIESAILGGNIEIFRIVERQEGFNYARALKIAIAFHNNELAKYCYVKADIDKDDALKYCKYHYNYEMYNYIQY